MLNTAMALWNKNPGAKRRRIAKMLLTILLIIGSAFLFLFTLNSSIWSPFAGAQGQRIISEEQPTLSNTHGIVIAGTPIGDRRTPGITPTATASGLKVHVYTSPCVQIPAVVAQQRTTPGPLNPVTYPGSSSLAKRHHELQHAHPKSVLIKTGKRHSATKPALKATIAPVAPTSKSAPVVSPVLPVATPTTQIAIPTATAITIIVLPPDGTTVSNLPAIVNTGATPDASVNSTIQFTSSLRQKNVVSDPVIPLDKSDKVNASVRENVACSRIATYRG